jgi:thymidine phosphorylase
MCPRFPAVTLAHTGGTLDKLERIPRHRTHLQEENMLAVLQACGLAIVGQTEWLVPADRTLYSLRDRTGTVESLWLAYRERSIKCSPIPLWDMNRLRLRREWE